MFAVTKFTKLCYANALHFAFMVYKMWISLVSVFLFYKVQHSDPEPGSQQQTFEVPWPHQPLQMPKMVPESQYPPGKKKINNSCLKSPHQEFLKIISLLSPKLLKPFRNLSRNTMTHSVNVGCLECDRNQAGVLRLLCRFRRA